MAAVTDQWSRPAPLPFDFIGTERFVEKTVILEKREGLSVWEPAGAYGGSGSTVATFPAYFVFVMTQFGDMRIKVSKKVFDLLGTNESIIVRYQRGRWSGALKGTIAR